MNLRMFRVICSRFAARGLSHGSVMAAPAASDPAADAMFRKLMTTAISSDYDGFMAECDATMKAALTKAQLESVSRQIAPRLKPG